MKSMKNNHKVIKRLL